jgi:hypothetical protein
MTPMYTRLTTEAARGSISRSKTINEIEDPCMRASADIWGLDARARGFERIKKPEHASKHTWQPLSYSTVLPQVAIPREVSLGAAANSTTAHPMKCVPWAGADCRKYTLQRCFRPLGLHQSEHRRQVVGGDVNAFNVDRGSVSWGLPWGKGEGITFPHVQEGWVG